MQRHTVAETNWKKTDPSAYLMWMNTHLLSSSLPLFLCCSVALLWLSQPYTAHMTHYIRWKWIFAVLVKLMAIRSNTFVVFRLPIGISVSSTQQIHCEYCYLYKYIIQQHILSLTSQMQIDFWLNNLYRNSVAVEHWQLDETKSN